LNLFFHQLLTEKEEERAPKKPKAMEIKVNDWRKIDLKKESFRLPNISSEKAFIIFKFRRATYLDIFLEFLPINLLEVVWNNADLVYDGGKKINKGIFDPKLIYRFFAIKIRVQGLQNGPKLNKQNGKPLQESFLEAREYFSASFPEKSPGRNVISKLSSSFLITADYFNQLSLNFQSIVRELGEYASGDEKLDRFTGNSGDIRLVPNKPARIGLGHYQLVGKVDNATPYVLDIKMARIHRQANESEVMANIVGHWSDVILRVNKNSSDKLTLLCFDTHYTDAASRSVLLRKKIKYIGAVASGRFGKVFDLVKTDVKKPGDYSIAYSDSTKEIFNYNWDKNKDIGKKMVIGNALTHFNKK
jgi:hypothetical protein